MTHAAVRDLYREWLEGVSTAGPSEVPPPPSIDDLLSGIGNEDPTLRGLLRYLAERERAVAVVEEEGEEAETEAGAGEGEGEGEGEGAENADAHEGGGEQVGVVRGVDPELRRTLTRMAEELDELRCRNDALADALGACYLCWGDDPGCCQCWGEGVPGSTRPDPALFLRWVAPAARRVRQRPATAPVSSPSDRSRRGAST